MAMDLDEVFSKRPDDPLSLLRRQDLDPLSLEDLTIRIATLEAEIQRTRHKIEASVNHRATADSLFKQ